MEQKDDAPKQTLEQVWFAGVHCDVGGGYRDPALSEIPLLWMADNARACGLAFRPDRLVPRQEADRLQRRAGVELAPDPGGPLHDSRTKFYKLLPAHDRRLSGDGGAAVDGGSLASSAKQRHDDDGGYRPPGVPEWVSGGREVTPVVWS